MIGPLVVNLDLIKITKFLMNHSFMFILKRETHQHIRMGHWTIIIGRFLSMLIIKVQ
jgi:hypothetical protein